MLHSDAQAESQDTPDTGAFTLWFADQRWEWSDEVYRMHGYRPGEVEPTTALVLSHKHLQDRNHVEDLILRALEHKESFSSRHRIHDTAGREHTVLVVADRILDADSRPIGTSGYYIDLTKTLAAAEKAAVDAVVPGVVESRTVIDQAKGVLMCLYGISAEQAFSVLVWRSQQSNVKVRAVAAQLLADLPLLPPEAPDRVNALDHVLLTGHLRMAVADPVAESAAGG